MSSELKIESIQVLRAIHLGKCKDSGPRVLKVTLDNEKSKWRIIKEAIKLRNSANWKNVYISPDLTRKEREHNKKSRLELKQRKDQGEKNLIIKRGRIVDRNPSDSKN